MRITSTIWIGRGVSSTRGGGMHRCIRLRWACLRIRVGYIGMFFILRRLCGVVTDGGYGRFRDIGYQHIPFFNCPNSPKCTGCKAGAFTDGEDFLYKEDCRPNWFKYVGMG